MTASTARTVSKSSAKAARTAPLVRPSLGEESAGLLSAPPRPLPALSGPLRAPRSHVPAVTGPSGCCLLPAVRHPTPFASLAQGRPGRPPRATLTRRQTSALRAPAPGAVLPSEAGPPRTDTRTSGLPVSRQPLPAHPHPRLGGPWPMAPDLAGPALGSVLHSATGASRPLLISSRRPSCLAPVKSLLATLHGPRGGDAKPPDPAASASGGPRAPSSLAPIISPTSHRP